MGELKWFGRHFNTKNKSLATLANISFVSCIRIYLRNVLGVLVARYVLGARHLKSSPHKFERCGLVSSKHIKSNHNKLISNP